MTDVRSIRSSEPGVHRPAWVAGKLVFALALAFWVRGEWDRVRGQATADTMARLDRLEEELGSVRVSDLDSALGRIEAALARAERERDAASEPPRTVAPRETAPNDPSEAPRVPPDRFARKSRAEMSLRGDVSQRRIAPILESIDAHVDGLSKDQRSEVEQILLSADRDLRKASAVWSGRGDSLARMQEASTSIRRDRYRRLQEALDPAQLRQLIDDVPFALGPPPAAPDPKGGGNR